MISYSWSIRESVKLSTKSCKLKQMSCSQCLFEPNPTAHTFLLDKLQVGETKFSALHFQRDFWAAGLWCDSSSGCGEGKKVLHGGWEWSSGCGVSWCPDYLGVCLQVVENIEDLKFEKGPWVEQDDVSYHHMRMLWVLQCTRDAPQPQLLINWIILWSLPLKIQLLLFSFSAFVCSSGWKTNNGWQHWRTYPSSCLRSPSEPTITIRNTTPTDQ